MTYRILDLFCGAGGCTKGYQRAGFYVVGVDIKPMPHYCGDEFHQADALEYLAEYGHEFDAIHASPPCQGYSITRHLHNNIHPLLIEDVREQLIKTGKPFVIENVPGAPLINPAVLDGRMFGLRVIRRRLFETNWFLLSPAPETVSAFTNASSGYSSFADGASFISMAGHNFKREDAVTALNGDCDWMTREELAQAIPPAFTEFIGRQLMQILTSKQHTI